ncbi:peptidyl-prolyl cis-trans isomerase FKBP16-4, chloroplastic [Tanacetum coccineum]|uniref:peptidylprolyl isomerase n=1 Tax=Tanacetum coccineum TaxID=301880 RepID=A0ABQ5GNR3_9ASTR
MELSLYPHTPSFIPSIITSKKGLPYRNKLAFTCKCSSSSSSSLSEASVSKDAPVFQMEGRRAFFNCLLAAGRASDLPDSMGLAGWSMESGIDVPGVERLHRLMMLQYLWYENCNRLLVKTDSQNFARIAAGFCVSDMADAASTSRRALKGAKVPESEYTTLPNGLKYYDLKVGKGAEAVKGSRVAVHYVAKWRNITFMTSRQGLGVGGGTPYGFDVGESERGNVLKGLDLGVQGMRIGGQSTGYHGLAPAPVRGGSRGGAASCMPCDSSLSNASDVDDFGDIILIDRDRETAEERLLADYFGSNDDGIYPRSASFVKSFTVARNEKNAVFKRRQEGARKDVERAFGRVLIVPPELAYGSKGVQEIPPNATIEVMYNV